jgi:hypothetical protein
MIFDLTDCIVVGHISILENTQNVAMYITTYIESDMDPVV